ncbi:MAG: LPS-assembly protein LptD [Burkholderiales bacterium]|nr:LPS-assembly protein LptD [Burkholderiales bacterium]
MPNLKLRAFTVLLIGAFCAFAHAEEARLELQTDPALATGTPDSGDEGLPIFIEADRIDGDDSVIEASGAAEIRRRGQAVFGEKLQYFPGNNEIDAEGDVRLDYGGDRIEGTQLRLNMDTERGFIDDLRYRLGESGARGKADVLEFQGPGLYELDDATYTTCPVGVDDWFLRVDNLEIDRSRQIGVARNASVIFKGVPILYTPYISFPLNDQRKTGVLTPIFGTTGKGGPEITIPYYWNIAPDKDATIAPRLISRRGLLLGTEFRYLDPFYSGEAHVEVLPYDRARDDARYGLALKHVHNFNNNWSGYLDFQKVSDDSYLRDLSNRIAVTSQTNLPREGLLAYNGGWFNFSSRLQRFQTLQDPLAPILPPYERIPQLLLNARKPNLYGGDWNFGGEFVNFDHANLTDGRRTTAYPNIAYPILSSFAYLTPKFGYHLTHYDLDQATTTSPDRTRALPITSVDSGLVLERDTELGGERFVQTLEPRAFYVYIPFREQNAIPNFDSAVADVNFTQIFSENDFSGGDRINDANRITIGLTSRFLEPETGIERFRATVAQRFNFASQEVRFDPNQDINQFNRIRSDLLAAVGGPISANWRAEAGIQYNLEIPQTQKYSLAASYRPALGKVLNLGYRFTRDALEQVDVSTQWPISSKWSGVARFNYSLRDSRVLEGLAGFEYNGGCWSLRVVGHRFAVATADASNSIFVQLELNGLSRIGSNPLDVLKQNIFGYSELRASGAAPVGAISEPY